MRNPSIILAGLSPLLLAASCGTAPSGDSVAAAANETTRPTAATSASATSFDGNFAVTEIASLNEPWAGAFVPGTSVLLVTEKSGSIRGFDTETGRTFEVSGVPTVDYGGQGGLGDIAFRPSETSDKLGGQRIYLSYAESGESDTRGAAVGAGQLTCDDNTCAITAFEPVWRQAPKTTGRGHYSHRLLFSQDETQLFIASGDRQKLEPAQDNSNTLGTIVRLNLDGSPVADNPLASGPQVSRDIYSWGHRNILGMAYDSEGKMWEIEHGPAGGDELNLVAKGANYGWPTRSNGKHYNGNPITDHSADDGFTKPAITWTPVIAPGDMIAYTGDMFAGMKGDMLVAGLQSRGLVRIAIEGDTAREVARYDLDNRIRSVIEGPDGALFVLEDGEGGRLLKLTPG